MKCRNTNCGADIERANAKFCSKCGKQLPQKEESIICNGEDENGERCAEKIKVDEQFCANCGRKVAPDEFFILNAELASNVLKKNQTSISTDVATDIEGASGALAGQQASSSDNDNSSESTKDVEADINREVCEPQTEDFLKKITDEMETYGLGGLTDKIKRDIDKWKAIPLNIGVIGISGTGKSSFINAIRNIPPDHKYAAKVGITETTRTISPYQHPEHHNLVFWDIPGVGTPNFSKDTYLKTIEIEKYDFFILVTASRFMENDSWLANEILKLQKHFYFIRTKIDFDLGNEKLRLKSKFNEEVAIHEVRESCANALKKGGVAEPVIFLLNNYNTSAYDFSKLINQLLEDAPALKTEALTLSVSAMSKSVLEKKNKVLKSRIFKVALLSAASAAVPLPGLGLAVDLGILFHEAKFYKKQFGTDEKSLRAIAKDMDIAYDKLVEQFDIRSSVILRSLTAFGNFIAGFAITLAVGSVTKFALPGIGSLISAFTAYPASIFIQRKMLDMCFAEAKKVISAHETWMSSRLS